MKNRKQIRGKAQWKKAANKRRHHFGQGRSQIYNLQQALLRRRVFNF